MSTTPQLLRFPQGELAAILRFRAKSEGLGKPAQQWNNSNIEFLAGLLEILWLASGAVDSTTTTTRPAIAKTRTPCCCSDLQSTTPFAEHYSCIIPLNCPIIPELCFMLLRTDSSGNYAGILDASLEMVAKCDKWSWVIWKWKWYFSLPTAF